MTAAGERYLDQAHLSLSTLDNAAVLAARIERGVIGSLTIAFYPSLASGRLRDLVASCHKRHPGIDAKFVELAPADQLQALRSGEVDVAFLAGLRDVGGLESQPLWAERIFVAMQADHALI